MTAILCVDSDLYATDLLRYAFEREGFAVAVARTGHDAARLVRETRPRLVTLDLDTIDSATARVLPSLRTLSKAPIVALSIRTGDEDVIAGFEGGVDDYVAKPFNMEVLVTRVKAVLRRADLTTRQERLVDARATTTYRIGGAVFDAALNRIAGVGQGGACITLTPTQNRILRLLYAHEGQPVSSERIIKHLWGEGREQGAGVIRTHIRHLREKIARLPGHPQPIHTIPRFGYVARQIDENGEVVSSY